MSGLSNEIVLITREFHVLKNDYLLDRKRLQMARVIEKNMIWM